MQTVEDFKSREWAHLQWFMLFIFAGFFALIFFAIDEEITVSAFGAIFAAFLVGVLGYNERLNLCLSRIESLGHALELQKEKYNTLEKSKQEYETAVADIAYLRDVFPSIDATIEKHHRRKDAWWEEPEKKPREYRTIESYESEIRDLESQIRDLESQIRQLEYKLNPPEVEFIERHY